MDRKTKLLAIGTGGLALAALIVIFVASCSARKNAQPPEPAPDSTDLIQATPTPDITPTPTPAATPPPVQELPTGPGVTPAASPTPAPIQQELPSSPTVKPYAALPSNDGKKPPAAPSFDFGLPAVAAAGAQIAVQTSHRNTVSVDWSLTKENALGLAVNSSGTTSALTVDGGTVCFAEAGRYTLIAVARNSAGKAVTATSAIEVYAPGQFTFGLPRSAYTDTVVDIDVLKGDDGGVVWSITRNGTPIPLAEAFSGNLADSGGMVTFREEGQYVLTGRTATGKTHADSIRVYLPLRFPFTLPDTTYRDTEFAVQMGECYLNGQPLLWSVGRNGQTLPLPASALTGDGGRLSLPELGSYRITAAAIDRRTGRIFSESRSISVINRAPVISEATATEVRSDIRDAKVLVNLAASASDPDGDPVALEWDGRSVDGYYGLGSHAVRVRARDSLGAYSDWKDISFIVSNGAPARPAITRTPSTPFILPGSDVTITASAVDPDGDPLTYIWENRPSETYAYPDGRQIVKVKAVDPFGAESLAKRIMFLMGDPNRAGNLMLTGPDSSISEPGIEDATLVYYKFVVPPVEGHSGEDFGRIRGYNRLTGQWEQLDYGTTSNGISFERSLTAGTYTKLDLHYYTNHDCMYNKSNITYMALFEFDELDEDI